MAVNTASTPITLGQSVGSVVPAAQRFAVAARWLVTSRRPLIVVFHLLLVAVANYLAFWLHFDGNIQPVQRAMFWHALPWLVLVRAVTFVPFGIYHGLWRYTGLWEVQRIIAAVIVSSFIGYAVTHWWLALAGYPQSIAPTDALILIFLIGGVRLLGPLSAQLSAVKGQRRVLVLGAGDAGETIVRDMKRRRVHEPVGFVDDDRTKIGQRIHGVPVLGAREDLPRLIREHNPHEVLIAVPSAASRMIQEVVQTLRPFRIPITRVPSLQDIHAGTAVTEIRNVSIEDLLARPPIGLDDRPLRRLIEGRSVMVTGAGGSIGSELCRQIAALAPSALVLYERYENNLFAISMDLADRGAKNIHPVIGDVTDARRLEAVMAEHRPDIVFHAAAHKHVPLMEQNACEAVKNNVIGSRMLMEAAERHGVDRFILISTDKAVNPTSVMGATKRIAECILQAHAATSSTRFSVVRFGNVLGSNGSVVPRFLEQIRTGGPITITHPDIRRYFMLIPEAVQLVLHSAALKTPGMVYVLEMGEQIKLVDMAKNLIRLSGLSPDEDIAIAFIGLRPGEKLFEELIGPDETARPAATQKILEVRPRRLPDANTLARQIAELEQLALRGDGAAVMKQILVIVPEFRPPDSELTPASVPPSEFLRIEPLPAVREEHRRGDYGCPMCGSTRLSRSRTRSVTEHIHRSVTQRRLHRCLECGWRGWAMPLAELREEWAPRADELTRLDFSSIDRVVGTASSPSGLTSAPNPH